MPQTLRQYHESRLKGLRAEVGTWVPHWKEITDNLFPRRGRFSKSDHNLGHRRNKNMVDGSPMLSLRTLQSGMMAGITSPARPWFKLTTPDPGMMDFGPVKGWLFQVERVLREIMARSNFYNQLHVLYGELGSFGTSPIATVEDFEDVVRAHSHTAGTYMLGTNDKLVVDTIAREYNIQVSHAVQKFGKANVSDTVRRMYENGKYDAWLPIVHFIEPNTEQKYGDRTVRGMAYRSCYYEEGSDNDKYLLKSGFREKPFMAPRWEVTGQDIYGRGPGMDALPDSLQLQSQVKWKGQGLAKMVNPPMLGDSAMKGSAVSTLPGSISYVDDLAPNSGFRPAYEVRPPINEMREDIREIKDQISKALYEDLFLMIAQSDRRQITAREIEERHEEKLLMLGPVLERLNDELLDPMIDRLFAMAQRARIIPPPPSELVNVDLRVEYVSIMAQAQKAVGTAAIERTAGFVGSLSEVYPEARHKFDPSEAIDEYADMSGVPPRIIRGTEEAMEMADQEQQAAAMQQGLEQAALTAQAGKTMAETPVTDQGTVLDQIMGTGPGA